MTSSHRSRSGVSLIEVGVAMTIAATMFGSAVVLFSKLLHADREQQAHVAQLVRFSRLAELFRDDVRSATSRVNPHTDDPSGLQLSLADGDTISYTIEERSIRRELRAGDRVKHRESFPLEQISATIDVSTDELQRVTLKLTRVRGDISRPALEATAALGRDHRYE